MNDSYLTGVTPYLLTKKLVPENQETPIYFINVDAIHYASYTTSINDAVI